MILSHACLPIPAFPHLYNEMKYSTPFPFAQPLFLFFLNFIRPIAVPSAATVPRQPDDYLYSESAELCAPPHSLQIPVSILIIIDPLSMFSASHCQICIGIGTLRNACLIKASLPVSRKQLLQFLFASRYFFSHHSTCSSKEGRLYKPCALSSTSGGSAGTRGLEFSCLRLPLFHYPAHFPQNFLQIFLQSLLCILNQFFFSIPCYLALSV